MLIFSKHSWVRNKQITGKSSYKYRLAQPLNNQKKINRPPFYRKEPSLTMLIHRKKHKRIQHAHTKVHTQPKLCLLTHTIKWWQTPCCPPHASLTTIPRLHYRPTVGLAKRIQTNWVYLHNMTPCFVGAQPVNSRQINFDAAMYWRCASLVLKLHAFWSRHSAQCVMQVQ